MEGYLVKKIFRVETNLLNVGWIFCPELFLISKSSISSQLLSGRHNAMLLPTPLREQGRREKHAKPPILFVFPSNLVLDYFVLENSTSIFLIGVELRYVYFSY